MEKERSVSATEASQERQREDLRQADVLAEIGRVITASLDIEEVYDVMSKLVSTLISFDTIFVNLVDARAGTRTECYFYGSWISEGKRGNKHALTGTLTEAVMRARSGRVVHADDAGELATALPALGPAIQQGLQSFLAVPLFAQGEVLGVLQLWSIKPNAYTHRDLTLAERVGQQIAGAIANAQLHAELEREAREREVLAEIGRIISSSLDIEDVFERFTAEVGKLLSFDMIGIGVLDAERRSYAVRYISGIEMGARKVGDFVPMEGTLTERVLLNRSTVLFQGVGSEQVESQLPRLMPNFHAGLRSFIGTPLIHQDEVIGVLHIRSAQENAYVEGHLAIAERICTQIAGAIASVRLHADLEREARERELLGEIGRIITSSVDIDEVYERFAEQVRRLIPFDRIVITRADLEQDTRTTEYVSGPEVPDYTAGVTLPLSGSAKVIARTRSTFLFQSEDREEVSNRFPEALPLFDAGLRSFLGVPLVARDQLIGILYLRSKKANAYTQRDVALAERVADQIAGAVAIAQLYEERIQMERSLRDSEERYRALAEHSPEAIFLVVDGIILYANDAGTRLFGAATADELIGMKAIDFIEPEYREVAEERIRRLKSLGESNPATETRIRGLDGQTKDVETTSVAIPYRGAVAGLAMGRDVTYRKGLQEQLLQAQKMQAIGTLAGGVAHDFNNMLTAIMSFTELATSKLPPGHNVSDYLSEVQRAAERAANLTRQLLLFSHHQGAEPRVLTLNDLIVDMNNMLRRIVSENIELAIVLSPDRWTVKVDLGQMEQVIANLVVNAVDAMPSEGKLTIATENTTLDGDRASLNSDGVAGEHVMMTVSDTGVGMTEDVKARAFDPFFTTKEVGEGSGLGLSTCYGIVTQSDGRITVDGAPRQGTTFRVYLPRVGGRASPLPMRDDSGYLPSGKETVLLVEDEPAVRGAAAETLRRQGYKVLEASNAVDALNTADEFDSNQIHLLLTDMVMPLMGGALLGEKFKGLYPQATVLYTSGYTDDALVGPGVRRSLGEFLEKPFTPGDLARKVRDVLDKR